MKNKELIIILEELEQKIKILKEQNIKMQALLLNC